MSDSPHCCFICNNRGVSARNSVQIFGNQSVLLASGRGVCEILSDILGYKIEPAKYLHSDIICKKCYKNCEEYDIINSRAKEIKSMLMEELRKTLTKYNIDYNNYELVSTTSSNATSEPGSPKVTMGPKTKLSPMPKNVVILHNGKKLAIQNSGNKPHIPRIDLDILKNKIPIKPSVSHHTTINVKTNANKINKDEESTKEQYQKQSTEVQSTEKAMTEIQSTEKQSFDILSTEKQSSDVQSTEKQSSDIQSTERQRSDIHSTERQSSDGQSTERQSSEVHSTERQSSDVQSTERQSSDIQITHHILSKNEDIEGTVETIEVHDNISELEIDTDPSTRENENNAETKDDNSDIDKFIISEVEIMDGDFELQDGAIVMEQDENGDFLRVINDTGRFLKDKYGNMHYRNNDQMSVLLPEDSETHGVDGARIEFAGQQFKMECSDSNEGQIELQMSGDEETASAILAAARKQGTGTYIKLESGGVFRLEGVSMELEQDQDPETQPKIQTGIKRTRGGYQKEIVERNGSLYTCLLCLDKPIEKINEPETDSKTSNISETTPADTKIENVPSGSKAATKYECRVIGNVQSISVHMKNEHAMKIYICELCGDVMRRLSQYLRHMDHHNPQSLNFKRQNNLLGSRPHVCTVCKRKFSSKNILEEHMNMHNGIRPYKCNVCSKSFASKYTHQAHMKTHTVRPRPFTCEKCNKTFLTLQNLSQHEKTHSGVKEWLCKVCGKAFGTQHNLQVHNIVHSGQKPFVCRTCGKSFARHAEIRDHERTHTGERPFPCDICGASFSQRSNLQSHRRACHFDDKRHSCPQCDRKFKRRRLLEYHIKASHTGERPHKCDICGASFVYPEHYKKHRRIHSGEKPYSCEVCGKPFNSRDNRNAHRFVHSDKKPYECMMCGMGFMRKPLLYTHMNTAGHLTDTIVVNQPQLSLESGDTLALVGVGNSVSSENSLGENGVSDNIDDQLESKDDDQTVALVEENETENIEVLPLTDTIEGNETELENTDGDALQIDGEMQQHIQIVTDENGHVLTTDENGTMIRLVQIQLPGGEHGWVALGP